MWLDVQNMPGAPPADHWLYADTLESLRRFTNGRGHPAYPCLSATHSPVSRIPCTDFSQWLAEQYLHKRHEAIAVWASMIVKANPGIVVSTDAEAGLTGYWADLMMAVLQSPLHPIADLEPNPEMDLRIALLITQFHDPIIHGFSLARENAARYLASSMIVHLHGFRFTDVATMIKDANAFIADISQTIPGWRHMPLFDPIDADAWRLRMDSEIGECLSMIRWLPLGSRAHLFDALSATNDDRVHLRRSLADTVTYVTRGYGLDARESTELLLETGFFENIQSNDVNGRHVPTTAISQRWAPSLGRIRSAHADLTTLFRLWLGVGIALEHS